MSWRDDLNRVTLPDGRRVVGASFRGVPFLVSTSERRGGRRSVTHEFPLRDDPYVEDLGRNARTFTIEGYVLGASYVRHRDALLSALEDTADPGELVHPYYGVKRAICAEVSVRETTTDGGMAVFAITFQEAPDRPTAPVEHVDLGEQVTVAAAAAQAATEAEFVETYDIAGLPAFALESAQEGLRAASAALYQAAGPLVQTTQELARLNAQVNVLTTQAASLVRQPDLIVGRFLDAVNTLADSVAAVPGAILNALLSTYDAEMGTPVRETTTTRRRERSNQTALQNALRRTVAIEAARRAPGAVFPTIDDAMVSRTGILVRLDEQIAAADNTAYPALQELRSALVRAVPGDELHARVLTVQRRVPIPSLLLSHQLYGSVDQEADLVARNRTPHPGFMAGDLQALSDG